MYSAFRYVRTEDSMYTRLLPRPRLVFVLLGCLLASDAFLGGQEPPAQSVRVVRKFSAGTEDPTFDPQRFLFSPEVVVDPKDGTVRLAHSVLVADEMGATDYRQGETLSDRVWARKVLVLDSADVTSAELFLYGSAREVTVNGKS